MTDIDHCHMEEFTEDGYRHLLETALKRLRCEPYGTSTTHPHFIMRHDIDMSVHRALAMARIEAEFDIQSTFCVLQHNPFYHVGEPEVTIRLEEILTLGHTIGLHFDCALYGYFNDLAELETALFKEKTALETLLNLPIGVVSFHNPDEGDVMNRFSQDTLAGMKNAYSQTLKDNYTYCSDSNGYWRHQRMFDLLEDDSQNRLHLLTHPVWWPPTPMLPRQRIQRCIDGRAAYVSHYYDNLLHQHHRENLGAKSLAASLLEATT